MAGKDKDLLKLQAILDDNKHLNFVQRILDKDKYPTLQNPDGSHSTHLMANAEVDGMQISFPTIVQNPNGTLRAMNMDQAIHHALQTGEYVKFKSPKEASWFSENYKKVWGDAQSQY